MERKKKSIKHLAYKIRKKIIPKYNQSNVIEMLMKRKYKEPIVCVELGCYKGNRVEKWKSVLHIKKIYLVDIVQWNDFSGWKDVEFFKDDSIKVSDKIPDGIDYIFYDIYDNCKGDNGSYYGYDVMMKHLETWIPKLKVGGVMSGRYFIAKCANEVHAILDYCRDNKSVKLSGHSCEWWITKL